MAAIGPKKGSGCPTNRTEITHAVTAAAVCCAIGQTEYAHRRRTVSIIRCTPWSIRRPNLALNLIWSDVYTDREDCADDHRA
jgi:hypothetical protein